MEEEKCKENKLFIFANSNSFYLFFGLLHISGCLVFFFFFNFFHDLFSPVSPVDDSPSSGSPSESQ